MSSLIGPIGPEQVELFAFEFGKIAEFDFDTPTSANINQSAPHVAKIYMTNRSQTNLILCLTGPE